MSNFKGADWTDFLLAHSLKEAERSALPRLCKLRGSYWGSLEYLRGAVVLGLAVGAADRIVLQNEGHNKKKEDKAPRLEPAKSHFIPGPDDTPAQALRMSLNL